MLTALYRAAKRTLDISVSATGLMMLSPVLGVTAGAIRWRMGTPILFRQDRPGLDGRPFELIKFRTMRLAAPDQGVDSDGDRLTPLGRRLRELSLDELPTLWNVLRGDMSLVGPRPLLMQYLPRYTPEQARRHQVKPGITGWAQIHGRNLLSWEEKFEKDVWYVDHQSFWLDLYILSRTVVAVVVREGISAAGQATMGEFRGRRPDLRAV